MKGRILAALAAAALVTGAGTAWAALTPEAGSPYPAGGTPYTVYAADFNRDGRPDIAVGNGDSQRTSVYLRQPAGGFAQEAGSPFSAASSNGAVGDFNGDGLPDLAFSGFVGEGLAVLLRSPAGGFTREPAPAIGGQQSAVGVGDFNGDTRVDLAVANFTSDNVSILLRNASNDGFTIAQNYATGGADPRQIAVADYDGNGLLDLAVTNNGSGTVTTLLGTGGGAFTIEGAPIATGVGANGIAAADFDGNGRPDLAISNTNSGTVSVLLRNAANNGFVQDTGSPITVTTAPGAVATGDFDHNGTPDIAVAANGGALEILHRGSGGFVRDTPTPLTGSPSGIAVADFNGDTVSDVAVTSLGTEQLHVLLSPSPPPPPPPPTATPTPTATPLGPPPINKAVNAQPVSGKVKVKLPGSSKYVDLATAKQLPNGTSIDTRDGRVTITAAAGKGKTEKADFFDGLFKIAQAKSITTLTLTEKLTGCKASKKKASAAAKKPKTRKLWGDGKGKFRTRGQYSAATIRGTRWLVQDGCGYTKTTVKQGVVTVRDEVKKKNVIVRKGHSYVARAKKR